MIGSTLYLVGKECETGDYVKNGSCCSMCKRMVINAGIKNVVIRDDRKNFRIVSVDDWIYNDDSLDDTLGY